MPRRLAAAVAALAMVLMLAAPAVAGGYAEIIADAQTEPPVEGQPVEVGFRVLQHGVTPAGWETPTVIFTNAATGESVDVGATNDRDDGHFVANATLPSAGYWSWRVTLKDLASAHAPVALTVATASGQLPTGGQSERLAAVTAERDALATRLAAAEGDGSVPLPAAITLGVLAGIAAGYAMYRLAGRRTPVVAISPTQREADPA